jgi:hypothetical protein
MAQKMKQVFVALWLLGLATNAYARGSHGGGGDHITFGMFIAIILFALIGSVLFGRRRR